jgi:hypothetical protein
MAITSKEINLVQLDNELGGQGLIANFMDLQNKIIKPADNSTLTEAELEAGIAAHIAIDEVAVKAAQKAALLERLGITEAEARLLLG